ncbi:MAG: hypothetical protein GXO36_04225 [Chloroflexi bacterium]|nr:hypothetical protein [Chloroflexota bacterium]
MKPNSVRGPVGWWLGLALLSLGLTATPPPATSTATPTPWVSPAPGTIGLDAPLPGAALQGRVTIHGHTAAPGFRAARLDLGYRQPQVAWFPLAQWTQPQTQGPLYTWDTTAVADGWYILRLTVTLANGQTLVHEVPVQVRNHTQPEPTPTNWARPLARGPGTPTALGPTPTVTPWPLPRATPAPEDPARERDTNTLWRQALEGGALVGGLLSLLLAWRGLHRPPS